MFGWDVAVLQFMLARRGALVPVYGYFDGATERAVRRYQRARRLASDGIAGNMTLTALGHGRPAHVVINLGHTSRAVQLLEGKPGAAARPLDAPALASTLLVHFADGEPPLRLRGAAMARLLAALPPGPGAASSAVGGGRPARRRASGWGPRAGRRAAAQCLRPRRPRRRGRGRRPTSSASWLAGAGKPGAALRWAGAPARHGGERAGPGADLPSPDAPPALRMS